MEELRGKSLIWSGFKRMAAGHTMETTFLRSFAKGTKVGVVAGGAFGIKRKISFCSD